MPALDCAPVAGAAALSFVILMVVHRRRYAGLDQQCYVPGAAWVRALAYFCLCYVFSWATGSLHALHTQPLVRAGQLDNPRWWAWLGACVAVLSVAYPIVWTRMSVTFERKLYLGACVLLGLLWGSALGQLLLAYFHLAQLTGAPTWLVWLLAYAGMGASQALVQSLFWDVYVAPEHDTPRSLKLKVPLSHTPNVITCLSFLVLHENAWLFVALQTYGLVACCIGQRFPAPWAREPIRAPMVERGKRGWLRATGHVEPEPEPAASSV